MRTSAQVFVSVVTAEAVRQYIRRSQMNFTTSRPSMRVLNVAFDVSSESLNWSMEIGQTRTDGTCLNETETIRETLLKVKRAARRHGFGEVRVICESTGIYHRSLLRVASCLGMRTNLVHGEAVAKYRTIRFADHGKTDLKDPQAILTVARFGRLIKHRQLDGRYAQLRELHRLVLRAERRRTVAKNELHADLRSLFADLRLDKSVLYGPTGRALMAEFAANPQAIVAAGYEVFTRRIKSCSKHTKRTTLERIWQAAEASTSVGQNPAVAMIQAAGVRQLYSEITRFAEQIDELESQMQSLYDELCQQDSRLPRPEKHAVSKRLLCRLVAEIGPPNDFQTIAQLMRYAGLNLCERQSGKWRGRTMISRRGRSEIRYVLNLMTLPLIGRKKLFGDYYWKKKEEDRMPGEKAMTCVMRKILKMFFGWYRSESDFDQQRVFVMASEYQQAAA